jgi:hypothetical protein
VRAPVLADRLERVRHELLAGDHRAALERFCAGWTLRWTQPFHPSHRMLIGMPPAGPVAGYRRATDFTTGEVTVRWRDRAGAWARHAFASRADDVVVQRLSAPPGGRLDAAVAVRADLDGTPAAMAYDLRLRPAGGGRVLVRLRGTYPPGLGAHGHEATTLVVASGGTVVARGGTVEVAGAASVLLLTIRARPRRPWPRCPPTTTPCWPGTPRSTGPCTSGSRSTSAATRPAAPCRSAPCWPGAARRSTRPCWSGSSTPAGTCS